MVDQTTIPGLVLGLRVTSDRIHGLQRELFQSKLNDQIMPNIPMDFLPVREPSEDLLTLFN